MEPHLKGNKSRMTATFRVNYLLHFISTKYAKIWYTHATLVGRGHGSTLIRWPGRFQHRTSSRLHY